MRTLSADFIGSLNAQETDEAIIVLMTVTHSEMLDGPIRISNHNTQRFSTDPLRYGTTSRGNQFEFFPFAITLPEEGEDSQPGLQVVLDNVSREITPLLVSVTTPPTVTIEIVLSSSPSVVEIEFPDLDLVSAEIDAGRAALTLRWDALVSASYPGGEFTPSAFNGLWATT